MHRLAWPGWSAPSRARSGRLSCTSSHSASSCRAGHGVKYFINEKHALPSTRILKFYCMLCTILFLVSCAFLYASPLASNRNVKGGKKSSVSTRRQQRTGLYSYRSTPCQSVNPLFYSEFAACPPPPRMSIIRPMMLIAFGFKTQDGLLNSDGRKGLLANVLLTTPTTSKERKIR